MPSDVNVLLVDDNPVILDMLAKALGPLAIITSARNGNDALSRVSASIPDLVISDYQMPGVNGRDLLQTLRARLSTSRVPVILMASKADQNEKLGAVRDAVEDFIEKPFFVRETVRRIKRVVDKIALEKMARAAAGQATVRGSLAQMNSIDLLQSLELGRKTCKLLLSSNGRNCEMYFAEGQLTHAQFGPTEGDDAVYAALTFDSGTWEIDFSASTTEQTTTRSTQGLLMEGLRLLDESNRDSEQDMAADA
jgi:CheY-like chemotaxis protein